jgi:hypothetical protein
MYFTSTSAKTASSGGGTELASIFKDMRDSLGTKVVSARDELMVNIDRAEDGQFALIFGRLQLAEPPLVAPLTQRLCAAYDAKVEQVDRCPEAQKIFKLRRGVWSPVVQEQRGHEWLVIDDDTGQAMIETAGADVAVHIDARFRSGWFRKPPTHVAEFLTKHGQSAHHIRTRYTEGVLEADEWVLVLGQCQWQTEPKPAAAPYREPGGQKRSFLKIVAPEGGKLLISDDMSLF